jgi:hypothetical protein
VSAVDLAINWLLYQVGWFCCVLGAAWGSPWSGASIGAALLAVHLALVRRRGDELALVLWVVVVGLAVDTAQIRLGTLRFTSGLMDPRLPPVWLVVVWAQFATTLNFSLRWLRGHALRAAIVGAVGGPLAYLAGARLGAVELASPAWSSLAVVAVFWGAALPLAAWVAARRPDRQGTGRYRRLAGNAAG